MIETSIMVTRSYKCDSNVFQEKKILMKQKRKQKDTAGQMQVGFKDFHPAHFIHPKAITGVLDGRSLAAENIAEPN